MDLINPQLPPQASDSPAMWDLVIRDVGTFATPGSVAALVVIDMRARDGFGLSKYKVRLQANNGRDWLVDTYQELLDASVYAMQGIYEKYGAMKPSCNKHAVRLFEVYNYLLLIELIKNYRHMIRERDGK